LSDETAVLNVPFFVTQNLTLAFLFYKIYNVKRDHTSCEELMLLLVAEHRMLDPAYTLARKCYNESRNLDSNALARTKSINAAILNNMFDAYMSGKQNLALDWISLALLIDEDDGVAHSKVGILHRDLGNVEGHYHMFKGARLVHNAEYKMQRLNGSFVFPRPAGRKTISIYCNNYGDEWWANWGPNSLLSGIGGSEEGVIYMSRALASLGYWVEVYGIPREEDRGMDDFGVMWYHYSWYDALGSGPDVFIAWR
jgi:hypothetical protein